MSHAVERVLATERAFACRGHEHQEVDEGDDEQDGGEYRCKRRPPTSARSAQSQTEELDRLSHLGLRRRRFRSAGARRPRPAVLLMRREHGLAPHAVEGLYGRAAGDQNDAANVRVPSIRLGVRARRCEGRSIEDSGGPHACRIPWQLAHGGSPGSTSTGNRAFHYVCGERDSEAEGKVVWPSPSSSAAPWSYA